MRESMLRVVVGALIVAGCGTSAPVTQAPSTPPAAAPASAVPNIAGVWTFTAGAQQFESTLMQEGNKIRGTTRNLQTGQTSTLEGVMEGKVFSGGGASGNKFTYTVDGNTMKGSVLTTGNVVVPVSGVRKQ